MNVLRRIIIGIGSIVVVALVFALVSPKAVRAVVSALVTVSNTTANPAITWDADKSTRIPYLSTVAVSVTAGPPGILTQFQPTFATVPAGYRLVIQNVNFNLPSQSANPVATGTICSVFLTTECFPSFTGVYTGSQGQSYIGNENVIRYIQAGDAPFLFFTFGSPAFNSAAIVSVAGYLENCAVTGCPPVVH
jgi:hypothetical protein